MDLRLFLGKSLGCFAIGESLRNVVLAMQCSMPKVRAIFLYENCNPVLNDIYIIFNVDFDEELNELHGGRYLIEFDPFLQIVRSINYTVSTRKPNATWKITGSFDICQHRPPTVQDFMSVLGDPLQVFTEPQGKVLRLLYDGLCLIFESDHPLTKIEDIKKLESHLTDVRLVPKKGTHFRCLIERTLPMHSVDLSLYGLVQIGLVIEEKYDQVAGINIMFSSSKDCENSKRVYFGQSCQCVMMSLGAPDFVYYQQTPTTHLLMPPINHSKTFPQQFIFNYKHFGLDIVFDVEAKQVKRFIFHSNLPDHVDFNMCDRCFYKFGITETGFAKKGQSLLVHPGVDWSMVTSYVAGTHVRLLSKIHRNHSTNAIYLYPLTSVWVLFSQLVCEVTENNHIATISVCSLCSDQQLGILGRKDEGLLVETSFQERNITEEYVPSSLSSVDNGTAVCSSDVKISLPDDDEQPQAVQPAHPGNVKLPSVEPLEESVTATSYRSTQSDSSDDYHSFNNNNNQDNERGKTFSECLKSHLPCAYQFQAYHPTRANQMSPCPNNIVITMLEDASREAHNINSHGQLVYVETFTESVDFTTCKETSNHILMENDKWRISCYSKEEQEAFAVQEEELKAMHQQSLEENFVCDSAMATVAEQPSAIINNDIPLVTPEFEETGSTADQEWQAKIEENLQSDENNEEGVISNNPVTMLLLESVLEESTQANSESGIVSEDVTDNKPIASLAEDDMLVHSNDLEEDKVVETELVYKPRLAKMTASRTQRILNTVTSLPKKHGEHQPKKKKDLTKPLNATTNTTTAVSHDQKSIMKQAQAIPKINSTKTVFKSKTPSTVKMDHRKVHFYTEEKSKAITAKLKSKESIEVVKKAHKDGSAYPHHHFKSNQLSALLHQGEDKVSDTPCKTPSTSTPTTFNRIFAAVPDDWGKNISKVEGKGLNTPFATEYNSTVYREITDGEDLASSDDQNSQVDQTTSQGDQGFSHDDQMANQDDQMASHDDQIASQEDQSTSQGNHTTNQDTKTAGQPISEDHQATNSDNQSISQINDVITNQIVDQATNQDHVISIYNDEHTQSDTNADLSQDNDEISNDNIITNKVLITNGQDLQTKVEKFGASSVVTGVPFDVVAANQQQNGHETDLSATKELSTFNLDEQHSITSLGDDTVSSSGSNHLSSTEHFLQEDLTDGGDNSQNTTPRKHWSSTQLVESTPDSLNQVHH